MEPHEHDERPWGSYTVLDEAPDYKVKTLLVFPGKRLSYQRHERRGEHWYVVRGTGKVTLDGVEHPVGPGSAIDVAIGAAHRIENTGVEDLIFIEVQRGESFDEDDVVRLEDDFGRASPPSEP